MKPFLIIISMCILCLMSVSYADYSINNSHINCSDSAYYFCDDFSDGVWNNSKMSPMQGGNTCVETAKGTINCTQAQGTDDGRELSINETNYLPFNRNANMTCEIKFNMTTDGASRALIVEISPTGQYYTPNGVDAIELATPKIKMHEVATQQVYNENTNYYLYISQNQSAGKNTTVELWYGSNKTLAIGNYTSFAYRAATNTLSVFHWDAFSTAGKEAQHDYWVCYPGTKDNAPYLTAGGGGGEPPAETPTNGTISISAPIMDEVFQRNITDSSVGFIRVSGNYSGTNTTLEASFAGQPFKTLVESQSAGAFDVWFNASIGQGNLTIRSKINYTTQGYKYNVSIGDIFVIGGQSNAVVLGTNQSIVNYSYQYIPKVLSTSYQNTWKTADDPYVAQQSTWGSMYPQLASRLSSNLSVPIAFIQTSVSGSEMATWLKGGANYNALYTSVKVATRDTMKVRGFLFYQGEAEVVTAMNDDTYKSYVQQMAGSFKDDMNGSVKTLISQINSLDTYSQPAVDWIRKGQQNSWAYSDNISNGAIVYDILIAEGTHFQSDLELRAFSNRWFSAILKGLYSQSGYNSPKLINATLNITDNKTIIVTFDSNINILNWLGQSGSQAYGWTIESSTNLVYNDSYITSTDYDNNKMWLHLNQSISKSQNLTYGSYRQAKSYSVKGLNQEPLETVFDFQINQDFYEIQIFEGLLSPNDVLVSVNTSDTNANTTNESMNCYFTPTFNVTGGNMTVNVTWYNSNRINQSYNYSGLVNNTLYVYTMNKGNFSKGYNWTCGVQICNRDNQTNCINKANSSELRWVNSNSYFNSTYNYIQVNGVTATTYNFTMNSTFYSYSPYVWDYDEGDNCNFSKFNSTVLMVRALRNNISFDYRPRNIDNLPGNAWMGLTSQSWGVSPGIGLHKGDNLSYQWSLVTYWNYTNITITSVDTSTMINVTVVDTPQKIWVTSPIGNDHSSGNLSINFYIEDPDNERLPCNLTVNGTNYVLGYLNRFNNTVTFNTSVDGEYYYNITCGGNSTWVVTNFSNTSNTRIWVKDTVNPDITWVWPNYPNAPIINYQAVTLNINGSDTYLNEKQINVTCNGVSYYSNYTINLSTTTDVTSANFSLNGAANGLCIVNVTYTDDNTQKYLANAKSKSKDLINRKIQLTMPDDFQVSFQVTDAQYCTDENDLNCKDLKKDFTDIDFIKTAYDRFSLNFNFTPDILSKNKLYRYTGILTFSKKMLYRDFRKGLTGLFVSYDDNINTPEYAMDFNTQELVEDITFLRIDNYSYRVIIQSYSDKITTKSFVGLNIYTETGNFTYDTSAPSYSNCLVNNSNPSTNDVVMFNCTWMDVYGLSGWKFWINSTGLNSTYNTTWGSNNESRFLYLVTQNSSLNVSGKFFANDSIGNLNETILMTFEVQSENATLDITPPEYSSLSISNSTPNRSDAVIFRVILTDDVNLSSYIFSWNDTGSFVNTSVTSLSGAYYALNVSKTITAYPWNNVCGLFYVNDTSNNTLTTSMVCLTVYNYSTNITPDLMVPQYSTSSVSNSTPNRSDNVIFRVILFDNVNLSSYTFSWNDTGVYVNNSVVNLVGNYSAVNVTKLVTAYPYANVCGKFYFNDTSNNKNVTSNVCLNVYNNSVNVSETNFSIIDYYPNYTYVNASEGETITFNVTLDNYTNINFNWTVDNSTSSITDTLTWILDYFSSGIHDVVVYISSTLMILTQSWQVNVTNVNLNVSTPDFLSPSTGGYDYMIPVYCSGAISLDEDVPLYTLQYSVNGGAWVSMGNNTAGKWLFDLALINYSNVVDFQCKASESEMSSGYFNPTGNITRESSVSLFIFDRRFNPKFINLIPYQLGIFGDLQNNTDYSIDYMYADCNGDFIWDYYWNYTNTSKALEYFECVNVQGTVLTSIGMVLEKNNTVYNWLPGTCNIAKEETKCVIEKQFMLRVE